MTHIWWPLLLIFLTLFWGSEAAMHGLWRSHAKRRLQALVHVPTEQPADTPENRAQHRLASRLTNRLQSRLEAVDWPLQATEYLALTSIGSGLLTLLAAVFSQWSWPTATLVGVSAVAFAAWAPNLGKPRRLRRIEEALPATLSLISSALRAGQSLLGALDSAGRETPEPLGRELRRFLAELRIQVDLEDALDHLAVRLGSADFSLVVVAVKIQHRVGGNLAELLDQSAETVRARLSMRSQVRALTAQGRLSGWIVGLLPVVLLLSLGALDPSLLQPLWTTTIGHSMLLAAAIMELCGLLIIRRILKVVTP